MDESPYFVNGRTSVLFSNSLGNSELKYQSQQHSDAIEMSFPTRILIIKIYSPHLRYYYLNWFEAFTNHEKNLLFTLFIIRYSHITPNTTQNKA